MAMRAGAVTPVLRRLAPVLLATGAVLVAGVVLWPTQRLVRTGSGDAVPIAEIWLWGRVRTVAAGSLVEADASPMTMVALVAAIALSLTAALLWFVSAHRPVATGSRSLLPATAVAGVVGAITAAAATGLTGVVEFGWFAYGSLAGGPLGGQAEQIVVESTVLAAFVPVAVGLWVLAAVVMLTAVLRGRTAARGGGSSSTEPT